MTEFKYTSFDEEAWRFNVDRAFFLYGLGILYGLVMSMLENFETAGPALIFRMFFGWSNVLFAVALFESICAVITKIALNPGCLLDTKFGVLKVFVKTMKTSYYVYFDGFKQVYTVKSISVLPYPYIFTDTVYFNLTTANNGNLEIPGYLKTPETFK